MKTPRKFLAENLPLISASLMEAVREGEPLDQIAGLLYAPGALNPDLIDFAYASAVLSPSAELLVCYQTPLNRLFRNTVKLASSLHCPAGQPYTLCVVVTGTQQGAFYVPVNPLRWVTGGQA